jgi:hypothetical protein
MEKSFVQLPLEKTRGTRSNVSLSFSFPGLGIEAAWRAVLRLTFVGSTSAESRATKKKKKKRRPSFSKKRKKRGGH